MTKATSPGGNRLRSAAFSCPGLVLLVGGCGVDDPQPTPVATTASSISTVKATESEPPTPGDPPTNTVGDLSIVTDDQTRRMVVSDGSDGPSSETLTATIILVEDGCYHASSGKEAPTLLLLPTGSTLVGGEEPALVVSGESYTVGLALTLTGDRVLLDEQQLSQAAPCAPTGDVFRVASVNRG